MPSLRRLTTGSKDIFKLVLHSLDWYCHSGSSSIVQQHEAGCVRWLLICLLGFPGGFYSLIQVSLQQCKQKCSVNVSFTWISLPQPPMPGRQWGNNSNTNNSNFNSRSSEKKNKKIKKYLKLYFHLAYGWHWCKYCSGAVTKWSLAMVERKVRVTNCNWKIKKNRGIFVCHGPLTLQNKWIQINFTYYLLVSRSFQLKWSVNQLNTSNFIAVRKTIQDALHKSIFVWDV